MMARAEIAARIPHAGRMVLLDSVVRWDAGSIVCRSMTHRDAGHPLARDGHLASVAGVEYACQAMALHGALTADIEGPPGKGFLASVRGVALLVDRLDGLGELTVTAEHLHGEAGRVIYAFDVTAEGRCVLFGRAAVVLA